MRIFICLVFLLNGTVNAGENNDVSAVINQLHQHAAEAKFKAYFDLFTDDAIFIGTDAGETWDIKSFRNYAKPVFDRGQGWTYTPKERHIYFSPGKDVAWFDELLDNASYGLTRGTGVLIKTDNGWKITQYHLTIPIPNDLAKDVANQIKAYEALQ